MFDPDRDPLPLTVYHGTDASSADDIVQNGVDLEKCTKGYFGLGFYTATEQKDAQSNYADFADDDRGVVLSVQIDPDANILDLRNSIQYEKYSAITKHGAFVGRDDFAQFMQQHGIDGLYDNSFGGIVIYNPKIVAIGYTEEAIEVKPTSLAVRPRG